MPVSSNITVGYVGSTITLICDLVFYNYPGWTGPPGDVTYNYGTFPTFNSAGLGEKINRLEWASNKRDLILKTLKKGDAGAYICSASNISYKVTLVIRVPPNPPEIQDTDTVGPQTVVKGTEDQTVTLTCISRGGYPAPHLDWYRDGTKLMSTSNEDVQSDGTYTVTITNNFIATRHFDKANFTCQSSFDPPDSPLSTLVMLYLSLKPSDPVITGSTTVTEDNSVQLQCTSTGCRPEGNMSWSFDGGITVPNIQKTQVLDTFTIISHFASSTLRRADNGKNVTCRVGHEALTSLLTTSEMLNVQFVPTTLTLTGNRVVVVNGTNTITLTCTVSSANPVSNISWTQDGQPVSRVTRDIQQNGQYSGKVRVQDITITPTRTMDGDAISCTAEHFLVQANQRLTQQINLDLTYKPIVTIREGSSIFYNEGDKNKILHCSASSKPASVFTWFHGNQQVKTSTSSVSTNQFDYNIVSVSKTHYGVYRCEADNSVLSAGQDSITVGVQFAPRTVSLTGNQQITANGQNKLTLTCTTDSAYPTATVFWLSGSSQITTGTSQTTTSGSYGGTITVGKLELWPTRTMDGDTVSCRGTNTQGPSSPPGDQVALNLTYSPLVTITDSSPKVVREGYSTAVLHCSAHSKPAAVFTWYKGNHHLNTSGTAQQNNVYNYIINNVHRTHYGDYRCRASNGISPVDDETIRLQVEFAPLAVTISGNSVMIANGVNQLQVTCETETAYPVAGIVWKNGTAPLASNGNNSDRSGQYGGTIRKQSLILTPTRYMDGSTIICEGANEVNSANPVSKQAILNLNYEPISTIIGGSQKNATEGDTDLRLDCIAESKPPATFTWHKTGVTNPVKTGVGTADNNRLVYTIPTVDRNHAGTYRCTADNGIETADNSEQELIVYYPPDVTVITTNTTINATSHFINCSAVGFPSSYAFTDWTQTWPGSGEIIREKITTTDIVSSSTRSLHFSSLTYQDTGIYSCGAGNGVKNQISSGSVFLLVKSSPVVIQFSNESHTEEMVYKVPASLNKRFVIYSTVYSNAGDIVAELNQLSNNTWINVNNTLIETVKTTAKLPMYSSEVDTSDAYVLTVNHSIKSQEEFGQFVLYLTNEIGTTFLEFEITPKGPPCCPTGFSIEDTGSDRITVSWIRCFHGGFSQTFVVQYSKVGTEWINGSFVEGGMSISSKPLNTTVDGLDSGTLYHLKLYAFNEEGRSNSTDIYDVRTTQPGGSDEQISIGPIVGGAAGGVVAAVLVIVLVLFILRRRRASPGSPKSKLLKENGRNTESEKNDDSPVIDLNPMYESAGPQPSTSNDIPIYSEVKKPTKLKEELQQNKDIYAEVKKPKTKGTNSAKKTENVAKMYSTPVKSQKGKQKQKKEKKTKANKKTKQDTNNEGMVYENANTLNMVSSDVYENPSCTTADEKLSRTKNDDGLIYIEVELPKKEGKGDRKIVIHGIEDTTDYADIVIGKVGEPAPESDEEETKDKKTD